jgi:hypothetical protein
MSAEDTENVLATKVSTEDLLENFCNRNNETIQMAGPCTQNATRSHPIRTAGPGIQFSPSTACGIGEREWKELVTALCPTGNKDR